MKYLLLTFVLFSFISACSSPENVIIEDNKKVVVKEKEMDNSLQADLEEEGLFIDLRQIKENDSFQIPIILNNTVSPVRDIVFRIQYSGINIDNITLSPLIEAWTIHDVVNQDGIISFRFQPFMIGGEKSIPIGQNTLVTLNVTTATQPQLSIMKDDPIQNLKIVEDDGSPFGVSSTSKYIY